MAMLRQLWRDWAGLLLLLCLFLLWHPAFSATFSTSDCFVVAGGNGASSSNDALNEPTGVIVDDSGNVFVSDSENGRIMKWTQGSSTGVRVAGGTTPGTSTSQLSVPQKIELTSGDELVIAESGAGRVSVWVQGATSGTEWVTGFPDPHGIALTDSGDLLVTEGPSSSSQYVKLVPSGSTTASDYAGGGITAVDVVTVDDPNVVYILNRLDNIRKDAPGSGGPWVGPGPQGSSASESDNPRGFDVVEDTPSRQLWMADTGNNRVLKCFESTHPCEIMLEGLSEPYDIFVSGDHFYVAEKAAHRVLMCPTVRTTTTTSTSVSTTFTSTTATSATTTSTSTTSATTTPTSTTSTTMTPTSTTSTTRTSTSTTSTSMTSTTSTSMTSTTTSTTSTTSTSMTSTTTGTTSTTTTPTSTTSITTTPTSTTTSTTSTTTTPTSTTSTTTTPTSTTSTTTTSTSATSTTATPTTTTSSSTTSTTWTPTSTNAHKPPPETGSEAAANLLNAVAAASVGLLDELQASQAQTQVTASITGGTITATLLGTLESLQISGNDSVNVSASGPEGVVELKVPITVFEDLQPSSVPGDSLALVVSSFSSETAASTSGQYENGVQIQVISAITIDLTYLLSRETPPVGALKNPVVFEMPGANYTEGLRCAYLKEEDQLWSYNGMETPEDNKEGQTLVCNTYHLSFFAAIFESFVATLQCAQFGLLTPQAIENLFNDTAWLSTTSAWMCWGIFTSLWLAFGIATILDFRRQQHHCWRDEFFLVATSTRREAAEEDAEVVPDPEVEGEGQSPKAKGAVLAGLLLCVGYVRSFWESSAVREAVDEILSSWFNNWGEVRAAFESLCEVLSQDSCAVRGELLQRAATTCLMVSSRRMVACSLGITTDAIVFVLEDEDLHDFLVEDNSAATGTREDDWRTSEDQRVAWTALHDTIVHHVLEHTQSHTICRLPSIMVNFFLFHNPLGALFLHDIFYSCKKRVLLLAVDFLGALALTCAFFDAAGIVRGKRIGNHDGCDGDGSIGWRMGRFLAIATGALITSALPVAIIESFQTKGFRKIDHRGSAAWEKQLRIWRIQDRIVWILGLLYSAFCAFFVMVFLASIGPADHEEWSSTGFIALGEEFILMPAFLAFMVPTITITFLHLHTRVQRVDHAAIIRRSRESFLKETNMMLPVMRV